MYGSVPTSPLSIESYRPFIGDERIEEIRALAEPLKGARILNINATAFGGGVAELLASVVPLEQSLGLDADWQVIRGADEFFQVTKAMHNALQGMEITWTPQMRDIWIRYNRMNVHLFDEDYDFVIVHDPQPAGLPRYHAEEHGQRPAGKWIWRCHLDVTAAQPEVWGAVRDHVGEYYDAAIFTTEEFVKRDVSNDIGAPYIFVVPPAIDPLSPKNQEFSPEQTAKVLGRFGLDRKRPFIAQISRFDPWKDPIGVIDVYLACKKEIPDLQLVLVASMASDDPEAWTLYERIVRKAGSDYDIHILTNFNGVGNEEVNAFQRAAQVVIQKSIREGFGLTVAEALWKRRPVVAGNVGGIPLQITDGETGFLVNTIDECTDRVLGLLRNPDKADAMGLAGREQVREQFLITRLVRDQLHIFNTVAKRERLPSRAAAAKPHPER